MIRCWLGTVLSKEAQAQRSFDEMWVRSETGLGAEGGTGLTLTGRRDTHEDTGAAERDKVATPS